MKIVEINALPNGGHRNQEGDFNVIPDGYAVIPEDMETPNFPFGEVIAEKIKGVTTVTQWIAGTIPEEEETETPEDSGNSGASQGNESAERILDILLGVTDDE